jgi:Ni/Co efflux regulator RcnB
MKKQVVALISLAVAASLSSPLAMAKNDDKKNHKDKQKHAEKVMQKGHKKADKHQFSHNELDLIQDYYSRHRYDAGRTTIPKGLQKKYERTGELPPGWQKKIQRGEVLPIDIYHQGRELPYDLRRQLPVGPVGSKIIEIEGKVIRLMAGTRMILDVLDIGR